MPYTDEQRAATQTDMLLDVAEDTSAQSNAPWTSAVVQLTNMGQRATLPLHAEIRRQKALREKPADESGDGSYRARRYTAAIRALGIINDPRSLPLLHELLPTAIRADAHRERYGYGVDSVYAEVVHALQRYADPTSVEPLSALIARLVREKHGTYFGNARIEDQERFKGQEEATIALRALARIGTEDALRVFMDNVWFVEKPAPLIAQGISSFGSKLEEKLHAIAQEADEYRKTTALEALKSGKSSKTTELAIASLQTDSGPALRAAFNILDARKDPRTADALEGFLDEALAQNALPTPEGYRHVEGGWRGQEILADAMKLYAALAGAASVPLLLRFAARDKDQRNKTAPTLIVRFGRDALPALQARVTNEDADVADAAATLLQKITSTKSAER